METPKLSQIFLKLGQSKKFQMISIIDFDLHEDILPKLNAPKDSIPLRIKSLHTKSKTPARQWCQFGGFCGPKDLQSGCRVFRPKNFNVVKGPKSIQSGDRNFCVQGLKLWTWT